MAGSETHQSFNWRCIFKWVFSSMAVLLGVAPSKMLEKMSWYSCWIWDRFQVFPHANRTLPLVHSSKSISKCLHYHSYGARTVISNSNWIARIKWEQWKSSSVMMMLNMVENGASGLNWWSISVDIAGCRGFFWVGFSGFTGHHLVCPVPIGSSNDRPMPQNVGSTLEKERLDTWKSIDFAKENHECVPC